MATTSSITNTSVTGLTVVSAETLTVVSTGAVINTTVDSGGSLNISSGGVGSATTILSGGYERVFAHGTSIDTVASSGGHEYVSSGGTSISATIIGGNLGDTAGPQTDDLTPGTGGGLVVYSGGDAIDTVLTGTGITTIAAIVEAGGSMSGGTLKDVRIDVNDNGIVSNTVMSAGGYLVLNGSSFGDVLSAGGTEIVDLFGMASGTTVLSGGSLRLVSGGTTSGAIISSGGTELNSSGSTTLNTTVDFGGTLLVLAGALNSNTVVSSGGTELISSGDGGAYNVDVLTGGTAIAYAGAVIHTSAVTTSAILSGGQENTAAGGTSLDVTVKAGGIEYDGLINSFAGGTSIDDIIDDGHLYVEGTAARASGTLIESGANAIISDGGVLSGATVLSSIIYVVNSGNIGSSVNDFIGSGATEWDGETNVYSDGLSLNDIVSGGEIIVEGGAVSAGASGTILEAHGIALLAGGGKMTGATLSSGGTLIVSEISSTGGYALSTTVSAGGVLYDDHEFGSASATVVDSGGTNFVYNDGIDYNATVSAGGLMEVTDAFGDPRGVAYNTKVMSGGTGIVSGGYELASGVGQVESGMIVLNAALSLTTTTVGGLTEYAFAAVDSGGLVVSSGATAADNLFSGNAGPNAVAALVISGATSLSNTIINNRMLVDHGGVTSGDTIGLHGILEDGLAGTFYGGTSINDTVSGGTLTIEAEATGSGTIVEVGGTAIVWNNSTDTGAIVRVGGTLEISGTGSAISTVISAGGKEIVTSGGSAVSNTVSAGGTELISSGGKAVNTVISLGGTGIVSSGGLLSGITDVYSGGTLVDYATVAVTGASLALGDATGGATLVVSGSPAVDVTSIVSGDNILFNNIGYTGVLVTGSGTETLGNGITVTETAGAVTIKDGSITDTVDIAGITQYGWTITTENGVLDFEICFAEGSMIATPNGETAVEDLAIGDMVTTLNGEKPIVWVGHRSVDLTKLRNAESARLVRIRKDAFATNVPHRDLLVTQEHCLHVDGGLIPARMLVNDRSIIIDRTINAYTYYHVELEQHAILLAEGLETESYLDTGNRPNFANAETTALQPDLSVNATHKSWATDAAAPLMTQRHVVEAVWRKMEARAIDQGIAAVTAPVTLTEEPGLRLATDKGMEIRPLRSQAGRYTFAVPAGATGLRLLSRASRPSDVVGPFVDDRRMLGVMVGEVAIWDLRKRVLASQHLEAGELSGWFDSNSTSSRWTNGNAALPIAVGDKPVLVEIEIRAAGPYLLADDNAITAAERLTA
ncbi:Hint domain-containing protein [Acidisoma cellulosilytica]|uniref:Hint domain-containing protein n=1 Tax=Acidisoma cellulosilyticum TaxID=2802395 RepID=A0A963Z588_9PROT|nr:Hint domain-containing protein [Acidisoma cellulosilyticum]MCB8882686.1 Hint domain-containing protein [Acidisoma cellulosilyticum]